MTPTYVNAAVRWQSGYAEACKALYVGSIPARTSNPLAKLAITNAPCLKSIGHGEPGTFMHQSKSVRWLRKTAKRWEPMLRAAFLLALIIVAYLSLKPGIPGQIYDGLDKWRHIAAYGVLGISGTLAFSARRYFWPLLAGLTLYGAALELAQTVVPYRTGSWPDFGANVAGVVIGVVLMRGIAEILGLGTAAPRRDAP